MTPPEITPGRGITLDTADKSVDAAILSFATEFREAILMGGASARMCAAISGPLCAAFEVIGIPCGLVETDLGECNHVFLQMGDGRVLDPTADQFNGCSREQLPGVYLGAGALIHQFPVRWPGGQEWRPLMAELKRLYPQFEAHKLGDSVHHVLRTLPTENDAEIDL